MSVSLLTYLWGVPFLQTHSLIAVKQVVYHVRLSALFGLELLKGKLATLQDRAVGAEGRQGGMRTELGAEGRQGGMRTELGAEGRQGGMITELGAEGRQGGMRTELGAEGRQGA